MRRLPIPELERVTSPKTLRDFLEEVMQQIALDARIDAIDLASAAEDVRGYLMDEAELAIWRPDIVHQLVRQTVFAPET